MHVLLGVLEILRGGLLPLLFGPLSRTQIGLKLRLS